MGRRRVDLFKGGRYNTGGLSRQLTYHFFNEMERGGSSNGQGADSSGERVQGKNLF